MSISFYLGYQRDANTLDWRKGVEPINLSNRNAADLLRFIGQDASEPCGEVTVAELEPALRRLMFARVDENGAHAVNADSALDGESSGGPGTGLCRMIDFGRDAGYLLERTRDLLELCQQAVEPTDVIYWG